jgi:hypothetical protein
MQSTIGDRLLGVEIECVVPIIGRGEGIDVQQLLADVLNAQGIRAIARSYCHQPIPNGYTVSVEHDTSLRDEQRFAGLRWSKIEVKTAPVTYRQFAEFFPTVLDVVNYFGARVNASCGFHVHHHLPEVIDRPQVVRSLQHLWWRFHSVMYGLVAPSRRSNQFCTPPRQSDARQFDRCTSYARLLDAVSHQNRYCGLNLTNLGSRSRMTVEWRIHQGTTDWQKVRAWVLATQRWVEHAVARNCHYKPEPMPNTRAGINALLVTTGLKVNSRIYAKVDKELRQAGRFLLRRWKEFNLPRDLKSRRRRKMTTAAA